MLNWTNINRRHLQNFFLVTSEFQVCKEVPRLKGSGALVLVGHL
jgi:hypothetical protein